MYAGVVNRTSAWAVVVACLAALSCNSTKDHLPSPPTEVVKLGQLVGKWKNTSRSFARNIREAAQNLELTFECAWTQDKNYLACTQMGDLNGRKVKETDIYGWSLQAHMYTMLVVLDMGDRAPQIFSNWFTWDKNMWHFLPRDGIRSTWEFKSADYHVTRTERTIDGVTWIESSTGEHKRIY